MTKRLFASVLFLASMSATRAYGQLPGLDLEPYIGVYIPFTDIVDAADIVGDVPDVVSQKEAFVIGGRVSLGLLPTLAIEGNAMYAFSEAEAEDGGSVEAADAHVWAADGRLVLRLLPGPVSPHIGGGIALIGRGGDAFEEVTGGKTDVGGVVGAGLKVKLPGIIALRGDADVFLYSAEFTVEPTPGEELSLGSQFQADLVLSAGLVISLGP